MTIADTLRAFIDPRNAVLVTLAAVAIAGTWLKLRKGERARRAIALLDEPGLTPKQVEAVAHHGREGVTDLFRVQGEPDRPQAIRDAAARALAKLWAQDELIPLEEQALIRRAWEAKWRARRRYPGSCRRPIPIRVWHGVAALSETGLGVAQENLEWSHRILGTQRAALEEFSEWRSGPIDARFEIHPPDFPGSGPHRLVLQAKVRSRGMTDSWEIALPHLMHALEFDNHLIPDALLASPDSSRRETIAKASRWSGPIAAVDGQGSRFTSLNAEWALRDPPELEIATPLPCDLAHALEIEIETVTEPSETRSHRLPAGFVVVAGSGPSARIPLTFAAELPKDAIAKAGVVRIRAILSPDPELGWSDPDIRSIWPEPIVSEWTEVAVARR